jgi:hypothetical protein
MRHIFSLRAIPISNDPEGAHVDAQDGQLEPRRAIGTLGAAMLEPIRAGLQIAGETQNVNHLFDLSVAIATTSSHAAANRHFSYLRRDPMLCNELNG